MQAPTLIGAEKGLTLPICTSSQPATYENSVECKCFIICLSKQPFTIVGTLFYHRAGGHVWVQNTFVVLRDSHGFLK